MPRKGEVPKRKVLPDPKYTDAPADMRRRLTKFVNVVMRDGKKTTAQAVVYEAFELLKSASSARNIKLHVVASRVVESLGQGPTRTHFEV